MSETSYPIWEAILWIGIIISFILIGSFFFTGFFGTDGGADYRMHRTWICEGACSDWNCQSFFNETNDNWETRPDYGLNGTYDSKRDCCICPEGSTGGMCCGRGLW